MIRFRVKTVFRTQLLERKVKKGNIKSLGRAGATIRLIARRSIRRRKKASAPGKPPHTRGKALLKKAILFAVERQREKVIIGPDFRVVGPAGRAHEFGGRFRGEQIPARPFMGPALTKTKDKLPKMWAGSVR